MHNSLNRLQSTFGFFTTCAFALASIIAFISLLPFPTPTSQPSATISASNVQVVKGRPHYYSTKREEYAQIRFNLEADLSGLFNWNTKQVFVYVTANYPSVHLKGKKGNAAAGNTVMSEAVIWDAIISSPQSQWTWENLKRDYWTEYVTNRIAKNKYKSKVKTEAKIKGKRRGSVDKKGAYAQKPDTTDLVKPGVLSLRNQKPKYQITDPTGVLSERGNVTLQVSWNVQPWVGALVWDKGYLGRRTGSWAPGQVGRSDVFEFPPLKGAKPEVVKEKDGPKTPEAGKATPIVEI